MNCPNCQNTETAVFNSRPNPLKVYRRRECLRCRHRFTTYEITKTRFEILKESAANTLAATKKLISTLSEES